jgi:hypothetical protein
MVAAVAGHRIPAQAISHHHQPAIAGVGRELQGVLGAFPQLRKEQEEEQER